MPQAASCKSHISTEGLAIFDKFGAAQKGDPRAHLLKGAKLQELVDHLKAQEPFLTTTRAIPTSADRMDGTSGNIMEAYYASIDRLHEQYPELDAEPSRTMNFDEVRVFSFFLLKLYAHHLQQAGLNNRGEFENKNLTVFTSKALLKLLRGRVPARTVALGDGSCNLTMIPFILGGNIRLATAFIGAVTASQVPVDLECVD
jgi:hypothetical protein